MLGPIGKEALETPSTESPSPQQGQDGCWCGHCSSQNVHHGDLLRCKTSTSTDTTKVQLASYNFVLGHARSLFSLLLQMWSLPAEGEAGLAFPFGVPLIILPQGQCEEERSQTRSLTGIFPHAKVI